MRKEYIIALSILILAIAVSINSGFHSDQTDAVLKYNSQVCVYKNNQLIGCKHNIVTNTGLNHTRDFLGAGTAGSAATNYIAVGNGTATTATSTTLNNEIVGCNLDRATGTYSIIGIGNWSLTKTWTMNSSCSNEVVNTTALFNASSSGTMFAGNTFSSSVTLQPSDQLNVTWTLWVTSG